VAVVWRWPGSRSAPLGTALFTTLHPGDAVNPLDRTSAALARLFVPHYEFRDNGGARSLAGWPISHRSYDRDQRRRVYRCGPRSCRV